jgi:hypothetical protein
VPQQLSRREGVEQSVPTIDEEDHGGHRGLRGCWWRSRGDFSSSLCRFVLDCTCGAAFDTNYIDEALEWRELHLTLAPLEDQLAAAER